MPYSGQTRMSDIAFDIHIQKKKTSLFLMFKKSLWSVMVGLYAVISDCKDTNKNQYSKKKNRQRVAEDGGAGVPGGMDMQSGKVLYAL